MDEIERYTECMNEIKASQHILIRTYERVKAQNTGIAFASNKRRLLYPIFSALAVCILLLCFANVCLKEETNVFSIAAYALVYTESDSIILQDIDPSLYGDQNQWVGYYDGSNFYFCVGLNFAGKNISSVSFRTKNGFFAIQHPHDYSDISNVLKLRSRATGQIMMLGKSFEPVGNEVTLNNDIEAEDVLLFWGTKSDSFCDTPDIIDIEATACFANGTEQSDQLLIDFKRPGSSVIVFTTEDAYVKDIYGSKTSSSIETDNLFLPYQEVIDRLNLEFEPDIIVPYDKKMTIYEYYKDFPLEEFENALRKEYIESQNYFP